MKITILTYGSRGDVQPFIALARGLQKNGHTVQIAAPHRFADFGRAQGVPIIPLEGDPEEISKIYNDAGGNVLRLVRGMKEYIFSIAVEVARGAFAACEDADLIVHSFLFTSGAHSLARSRGIPDVSIQTFPIFAPTRTYPPAALSWLPTGPLSYFGHWLNTQVFWYGGNSGYAQCRRQHPEIFPFELTWPFETKRHDGATPLLFAISPAVLPPAPEWANRVDVVGYFFLDSHPNYHPSAELVKFLEAGPAPICVTFGSMINRAAERIADSVLRAIRISNQRAVILTGWDGWKGRGSTDEVLLLDSAPHDWLLPLCKAVIHHGGAGTTAAGLRAGIPNIVIPFAGDQLFWGKRIHAIGAGPEPIPRIRLNPERLSSALAKAEDKDIRMHARVLGQKIGSEAGVEHAVRMIEPYVSDRKIRSFFKVGASDSS